MIDSFLLWLSFTTFKEQHIDYVKNYHYEVSQEADPETNCMIKTLYHESRGESEKGIKMVAEVIINRTKHKEFPSTICEVVKQKYAFSFYSPKMLKKKLPIWWYRYLKRIATNVIQEGTKRVLPPNVVYFKVCDYESSFFNTRRMYTKYKNHCYFY